PEAVRQRADLQVAEITIVLHLLTGHDYPPDILSRTLSAHPESSEGRVVGGINGIESRGVGSYRHRILRKRVRKDTIRPVVKLSLFRNLTGRNGGGQTTAQREQTATPRPGAGRSATSNAPKNCSGREESYSPGPDRIRTALSAIPIQA